MYPASALIHSCKTIFLGCSRDKDTGGGGAGSNDNSGVGASDAKGSRPVPGGGVVAALLGGIRAR
jgi:hypothetical protein